MSNSFLNSTAYHIYCDEFGDQALKSTASEWFIIGAIVVAEKRVPDLPTWITSIKRPMKNQQRSSLHFTDLDERMKLRATRFLGKLPVRCFAILSHKQNMLNYSNPRCGRWYGWYDDSEEQSRALMRQQRNAYPNFLLKVLLERVTAWCLTRSIRDHGGIRPVKMTIAQRGGFHLDAFKSYLEKDRRNWINRTGTLPGYLAWPVVDLDLVNTAPAADVAGLQLADVVTGAFSRAIDENRFGVCDRRFIANLMPRIAVKQRMSAGFGVTGLPWELSRAPLSFEQQQTFRMFGYGRQKLARSSPVFSSPR